jgi:SAM-dependent methyltransferase
MQVFEGNLEEIGRYIAAREKVPVEEKRPDFEHILRSIRLGRTSNTPPRVLEIGSGTGWFAVLCALQGIDYRGIEISPQLVECSHRIAESNGVRVDVQLGNLEDVELGVEQFDAVVANFVFEHVEFWRPSVEKIYRALRPGGAFVFSSTNKFTLRNGEYPKLPMYGWLPNRCRYWFRQKVQGPDIMKLGIDFHQFTYPQLRRAFREIGFTRILDHVDIADPSSGAKRAVVSLSRALPPIRHTLLLFFGVTSFVCGK